MSFKAQFSSAALAFAAPAVAGQPQGIWDVALPQALNRDLKLQKETSTTASFAWDGRIRLAVAGAAEKLSAAAELERERLRLTAEGITDFSAVGDHAVFLFNGSLWRSKLQCSEAKRLGEAVAADAELVIDKARVQPSVFLLSTTEGGSLAPSVADAGPLLTPRVSPDGRWVAFVVDGSNGKTAYVAALPPPGSKLPAGGVTDIFPVLPGVKHALGFSTTGSAGADTLACPAGLSVGTADYLAQEEFGRMEGLWWAPDSSKLLLQCTQEEPLPPATAGRSIGASGTAASATAAASGDGSIVQLPHPTPAARAALQRDMEREYGLSSTADRWADEDADADAATAGSSLSAGSGGGGSAAGSGSSAAAADDEGAPERFRYYFAGGRNPRVFFAVVPHLDALRDALASGAAAAPSGAPADAVAAAFSASTAATQLLWPSGAVPTVDTAGAASSAAGAATSAALLPLPAPAAPDDVYVPRAHWLADSSAAVLQVLNRTQDCTELWAYRLAEPNVASASAPGDWPRQLLLRERAGAGGWLNVHDCCVMLPSLTPSSGAGGAGGAGAGAGDAAAKLTPAARGCGPGAEHAQDRLLLWASERTGFRHLYLYGWGPSFQGLRPAAADAARAARIAIAAGRDADTGEGEAVCLRAVTSGPWPVESVLDVLVLPQLRGARREEAAGHAGRAPAAAAGRDAPADADADAAIDAALHRACGGGGAGEGEGGSSWSAGGAAALRRTAVLFQAAGQTPCESHVYVAPLLSWQPLTPQRLLSEDPAAPLAAQLLQDAAPADGAELPSPRYSSADGSSSSSSSLWWFERETSAEAVAARILAARELAAYAEHVRYCRHGIVRLTAGAGTHRSAVSPDGRWLVDELSTAYAESPSLTLFSLNASALAVALGMAPAAKASAAPSDTKPASEGSGEAAAGGAGVSAAGGQPAADSALPRRAPRGLRGSALLPGTPAYAAARLLLAGPALPGDEPPLPSACQLPKPPSSPLASAASAASAACSCGGSGSSAAKRGAAAGAGKSSSSSSSSASGGGCTGCCTGEARGRSSTVATPSSGGPPAGRASWSPAARRSAAKKESRCCGPSVPGSSSSSGGSDFFSSLFGSASSSSAASADGASSTKDAPASAPAEDLGPSGFKHVEGGLWGTVLTRSGRAARSSAWPRDRMAASVLPFEASGPYASAGACAYAASYPLQPAKRPAAGSAAAADSAPAGASASSRVSLRRARRDAASGGFVTPVGVIAGLLPHPYAATMAYLHDAHRLMGEGSEWLPAALAEDDGAKAAALGVPLSQLLRPDMTGEYDDDDDDDGSDSSDGDDGGAVVSDAPKEGSSEGGGGSSHKRHGGRRKSKKHRDDDGDGISLPDGSILDTLSRLSSRFLTAIGQASAVVGAAMGDDDDDDGQGGAGDGGHGKRKRRHRDTSVPAPPPAAALAPAGAVAGAFSMRPNLLLALAFPAGLASFEALAGDAKAAPVGRRRAVFHPRSCYNDDPLRQDAPPKPQRPAVLALRTAPALCSADGTISAASAAAPPLSVSSGSGMNAWPVPLYSIASNDASTVMFSAVTLPVLRRVREAMLRAREAASTPAAAVFASCFGVDAGTWPAFGQLASEASPPGSVETTWMAAPAVLYVYGGPGVRLVSNDCNLRRGGRSCAGAFAKEGFVTAMIDGRGSTGRGTAFERAIRLRMGGPEADDQVAGLQQLAVGGVVHPGHVGVHGWSYGGYMTLRLMSQGREQAAASPATAAASPAAAVGAAGGVGAGAASAAAGVDSLPAKSPSVFSRPKPQLLLPFRAGVSGAPVTDWRFYDTAYTERYMGLPSAEGGVGFAAASSAAHVGAVAGGMPAVPGSAPTTDDAYDAASVLRGPQRLLNLAGRHLLMLHGTKDENVLPQNTEAVANALPTLFGVALMQRQGMGATAQNFRLRWLPGQRHALRGPASTRRDNMTVRFLADHVLGVVTQKEAGSAAGDD